MCQNYSGEEYEEYKDASNKIAESFGVFRNSTLRYLNEEEIKDDELKKQFIDFVKQELDKIEYGKCEKCIGENDDDASNIPITRLYKDGNQRFCGGCMAEREGEAREYELAYGPSD